MTEARRIPLIVFGVGNIGRTLLAQVLATHDSLAARYGVDLWPVALAEIDGLLIDPAGIAPDTLHAVITTRANGQSFAELPGAQAALSPVDVVQAVADQGMENAVVVDVTAAGGMEPMLSRALALGYGAALANKRPMTGPWDTAREFFEHPLMRFEATVGAGIPAIYTLRYLVDTGDIVGHIEGAFSGTLGFLCSQLEDGAAYSATVTLAKQNGYTEPDPRDDLGGKDVARKALILARLAGWPLEAEDFEVEALYPADMADLGVPEFMEQLPRLDDEFAARLAASEGAPRYLAEVTPEGGSVGLKLVDAAVAAQLRGTLNQVKLTTVRYAGDNALRLIGPGAGLEVTAAGVLNDCIQLARVMP